MDYKVRVALGKGVAQLPQVGAWCGVAFDATSAAIDSCFEEYGVSTTEEVYLSSWGVVRLHIAQGAE